MGCPVRGRKDGKFHPYPGCIKPVDLKLARILILEWGELLPED